jgi:hypothetical protein
MHFGRTMAHNVRPMRAIALLAVGCLVACSSKEPKHPMELGSCTSISDGGCANPVGGGGGGGTTASGKDSSTPTGDGSSSGSLGCGVADSLVNTMNTACRPCLQANCCTADMACTGACASLLQSTQTCMPGDTLCVGNYENTWQGGFTAYKDFAACLSMNCIPACPKLQQ